MLGLMKLYHPPILLSIKKAYTINAYALKIIQLLPISRGYAVYQRRYPC